jgi:putative membrane protein
MILKRKRRERNPWIGMAAGLIGGIAGSVAIGQFSHIWAKATKSDLEKKGMESTVKAAEAISKGVLDKPLPEKDKERAASAVHFGFGGAMGALYGASAALEPKFAGAVGVPFGASVYLGAHAAAVPALGLGEPVTRSRFSDEAGEFLGHLVYGLVTDLTRRGVIAVARAI